MKQITKRLMSMMIGVLLVFGAAVVYFNLIQPADQEAQSLKSELYSKESVLETQKAAIEQVEKLIKEYEGEGKLQDLISQALPTKAELASAMAQIAGLITNNGLKLKSLAFGVSGIENVALAGEEGAQGLSLVKPIGAIRIQASFSGSYEDGKRLIENIENNLRIFEVVDFGFTPPGKEKGSTDPKAKIPDYTYGLTVVTYYQGS